jgi:RHS repeat-associated protein
VVNYEYDAQGNLTKVIKAPGVAGFNFATASTYDRLERAKDTTDAKAGITRFGYNGREDLTSVTDPRNLVTQYQRNGLADTTRLISPDTGTANQTYDAAGKLLTRTDSRSVLATYSYDSLNRLTGVVFSKNTSSRSYTYTYDQTGAGFAYGIGRLTSSTFPEGSGQYVYDAQGRLTSSIQRVNAQSGANSAQRTHTVGYAYDAAGNVTSLTYPSGRVLEATYANGQLSALALKASAGSTAVTLLSDVQWEPFGAVRGWQWQMNSGTQPHLRVFDSSGRMVRYRLGNTLRDLTFDPAGRITAYAHYDAASAAAQATLDQTFGYDELGRITTIAAGGANWSIGYDANGNRTSVTQSGTTRAYTTAATRNRLTALTNPAQTFTHDAAGNTLTGPSAAITYTATYNLENRLRTMKVGTPTTTYIYDAMGQRVRKHTSTGAATTVIFAYDQQGHLLGEYDNTGAAIREYVWLGDEPVAVFTPNGTSPPNVFHVHTDHLGAPRVLTDKSGQLRWRWLAEPFGTTAPENNPAGLGAFTFNLRMPGQYADGETGLFYNYFRDYDASAGRYVQSDPIGLAGGINTYSYVLGNPANLTDPYGLQVADDGLPPPHPGPWIPNPSADAQRDLAERLTRAINERTRERTYQTYTRWNPITNQCYTGRTSGRDSPEENVRRRSNQEAHLTAEGFRPAVLDRSSPNRYAIRGREQLVMDINGGSVSSGGRSRNIINGISPMNPMGRYVYIPSALTEFGEPLPAGQCECQR